MTAALHSLLKISGFEATDYAWLRGELVWAGEDPGPRHPRNARHPWQPAPITCDAARLRTGARACLRELEAVPAKGLLLWLTGRPLPFPLDPAAARFDAVRNALERNDLSAFEAAALRVLGLGHGLTPSGDDFVGGICFALRYAPRDAWRAALPAVLAEIRRSAAISTNVISAALLGDLIDGASHDALHELLAALQDNSRPQIARATQALLAIGASSGADMLAGLLVGLLTTPHEDFPPPPP